MTVFRSTALLALVAAISVAASARFVAATPTPKTDADVGVIVVKDRDLSAERAENLNKAFKELSLHKPGSSGWFYAAARLLKFGPDGARKMLPVAESQYRKLGREYAAAFQKRGRAVIAARLAKMRRAGKSIRQVDDEIRDARKTILALVAKKDLQKSDLVAKGDPAMEKLTCLMSLDRVVVLKGQRDLLVRRTGLLKAWTLRNRCAGEKNTSVKTMLVGLEESLAACGSPISEADRKVLQANHKLGLKLTTQEAAGIRDLNRMRLLVGLKVLSIDLLLSKASKAHARDMVEKGFFSHTSPVPGKTTAWDRARKAGTDASGENIAYGTTIGTEANKMWFHSPGHFKNMLSSSHRRVGLGNHDRHWAQMFGR